MYNKKPGFGSVFSSLCGAVVAGANAAEHACNAVNNIAKAAEVKSEVYYQESRIEANQELTQLSEEAAKANVSFELKLPD